MFCYEFFINQSEMCDMRVSREFLHGEESAQHARHVVPGLSRVQ